jgi:hypothetical protein
VEQQEEGAGGRGTTHDLDINLKETLHKCNSSKRLEVERGNCKNVCCWASSWNRLTYADGPDGADFEEQKE